MSCLTSKVCTSVETNSTTLAQLAAEMLRLESSRKATSAGVRSHPVEIFCDSVSETFLFYRNILTKMCYLQIH